MRCFCIMLLAVSVPSEACIAYKNLLSSQWNTSDTSKTKYYKIDYDIMNGKLLNLNGTSIIMSEAALDEEEISLMQEVLSKSIFRFNRNTRKYPEMKIELRNYGVQYLAYLNEKGQKIIWINGFCDDMSLSFNPKIIRNYNRVIITAFDGGSCYFNTSFRLKGRKSVAIYIHGMA